MRVETSSVTCKGGLPAFVATPVDAGRRPLIVLMHERYGFVQHTRDLAERHAREGFVCIAPDFFFKHPDQEALHRGDVGYLMSDPESIELIDAAVAHMRESKAVDAEHIAVIGVCQTGRYAVVYAAHRPISAAVAWYGAAAKREWGVNERVPIGMDDLIGRLQCPTLGVFGERDHVISLDDIAAFRASFERHRKSYTIEIFAGAPHGWLNDTMPGRYRREPAEAAWALQKRFLDESFDSRFDRTLAMQRYVANISRDYDFSKNIRLE